MSPRHAWIVEPSGNFAVQDVDPALGTPGGFSAGNGYGPYTLNFGDSIRVVWAEAASGLSRAKCIEIGNMYKEGLIDAYTKNQWVLTGKDSLYQTFRRAIDNYKNNYESARAPQPPLTFSVTDSIDYILLEWIPPDDATLQGFRIFRSTGKYDNNPVLVAELPYDQNVYRDYEVNPGTAYYYYIVSLGQIQQATPELGIPESILTSSRYYTQTYEPVIPGGTGIVDKNPALLKSYTLKQNYPNPFNPYTTIEYQLPFRSKVKIAVYNTLGQRLAVLQDQIQHTGHYKIRFRSSGLPSGIYFCQMVARSIDGVHEFKETKKMLFQK
jgi:hypothetical protein